MRLLLVDGTNVVMRCASVQTDVPRDAVIASAGRIIRRAAEDIVRATHLVVAFDAPGHSFRRELEPSYKAHRGERQAETSQWAMDACTAFEIAGVFCAFVPRFEADDVIATIAARTTADPTTTHEVAVLSGDSDLLALASDRVQCWQFARKDNRTPADAPIVARSQAWICERFGLTSVSQLTDYKALVGEPGDNVKGARGVGPVKARALLKQYGTIDRMIDFGQIESPGCCAPHPGSDPAAHRRAYPADSAIGMPTPTKKCRLAGAGRTHHERSRARRAERQTARRAK